MHEKGSLSNFDVDSSPRLLMGLCAESASMNVSGVLPSHFCTNGYAASSDPEVPGISASGRCYYRDSSAYQTDCSASYAGKKRLCICSSPCHAGYYGTSGMCRKCPPRSLTAEGVGMSSVTDCKCVAGTFLVANLSVPFGGSGYCQPCPVHTLSPSGSTQPTGVPSTHSLFLSLSLLCLLAWAPVPIAAIIAVDEGLLGMCSQSIAYSKRLIIKHPLKPNLSLMPHFQIAS